MGYKVEVVVFDDYLLPNNALVEGSLDANFYQHKPFMDDYNKNYNSDIVMLEPKLYEYYAGLYSTKADSVAKLPNGGNVAIAEDASNIDTDLRNLEEAGVITLTKEPQSGTLYSILDIVTNPHNFKFVSGDHAKYQHMDEYVAILGTSNTMAASGVDPTKHLLTRFSEKENALGMCVMAKNKDAKWAKDIMTAYQDKVSTDYVKPETGFVPAFK